MEAAENRVKVEVEIEVCRVTALVHMGLDWLSGVRLEAAVVGRRGVEITLRLGPIVASVLVCAGVWGAHGITHTQDRAAG